MKHDPVDVLIIGAGASGAAVAWSLADTKMHILCLDQGGWMNPSEYPSTGRDWEAKFYGDWSTSPNIRGRPEDYPINDDNSPIKVVNFNGVGGSTVMYTAHWPRLHPSDFKVKTLDGVADDWPIDYDALTPFFEENDRIMGVSGLSGDPMSPLTHPPMPPQPLGLSSVGTARVARYEPERVVIRARSATPALVVLDDVHYPGWEATVDGHSAPIHQVDYLLRGVRVPAGTHTVEMRYRPQSWRIGWIVSLIGLLVLAGLTAYGLVRHTRTARAR